MTGNPYYGLSVLYISSAKYAAIAQWAASTGYTVGQIVRPLTAPSVENEYAYMCIVAGTSNTAEPTSPQNWTTTTVSRGQKFTDNTVTWVECTGQPAINGDIANTPNWATVKNQTIDSGMIIKDAAGTHLFVVSSSPGATGNGAEPTWNTSAVGNTTTDNAITWTYIGPSTTYSAWACPHARIVNCIAHSNVSAVNTYIVGNNHNPSYSGVTVTYGHGSSSAIRSSLGGNQSGPAALYVVNESGSMPPVSADLVAGTTSGGCEKIGGTGFFNAFFYAMRHVYGLYLSCSRTINVNQNAADHYWENCTLNLTGSDAIQLNSGSGQGLLTMKNCTFKFGSTSDTIGAYGNVHLIGCTFDTTSAIPNDLFEIQGGTCMGLRVVGSDLSAAFSDAIFYPIIVTFVADFVDCKLPSSPKFVHSALQSNQFDGSSGRVNFVRCDNGTATFKMASVDANGVMTTNATRYRTGGASDGTTPYSWQLKTSTQCIGFSQSFRIPPIASSVTSGSALTATIYGIMNSPAMPTNAEVYADVQYLGDSGDLISTFKTSRASDFLPSTTPSNLTADTSAWDAGGTARQNSHTYAVGDEITVASNPGRVFFCTTGGASNSSEPGGYATAVDGGSVTDNAAVFRAGWRFKFTVSLSSPSPQLTGYAYTHIYVGKISTTVYLDPEVPIA